MDLIKAYGFQYLSVGDKELFARYYDRMNDDWVSSISFASMIAWNKSIKIFHKKIGEYLCCLAHDTTCDHWVLLPLLGDYKNGSFEECFRELQSIMKKMEISVVITDVSEWMLPYYLNLKSITLKATYELGLSDYIYSRKDFEEALNRQNSRYDYNYFVRRYHPQLALMAKETSPACIKFLSESWCRGHECSFCQYGCLLDSIKSIFEVVQEGGAYGITVYVKEEMVGFTIVTKEKDQLIFHFKESKHKYRGLNCFMHKHCFELFGSGAKNINYTEDMNLAGLRKYKQILAKYELHHKYELR